MQNAILAPGEMRFSVPAELKVCHVEVAVEQSSNVHGASGRLETGFCTFLGDANSSGLGSDSIGLLLLLRFAYLGSLKCCSS